MALKCDINVVRSLVLSIISCIHIFLKLLDSSFHIEQLYLNRFLFLFFFLCSKLGLKLPLLFEVEDTGMLVFKLNNDANDIAEFVFERFFKLVFKIVLENFDCIKFPFVQIPNSGWNLGFQSEKRRSEVLLSVLNWQFARLIPNKTVAHVEDYNETD